MKILFPSFPTKLPRKLADSKAKAQVISELASPMTLTNTITTLSFGKTKNDSSSQRPIFPRANSPKFVRWKPIRNPLKQFSENLVSKFQPMESLLGVTFNVELKSVSRNLASKFQPMESLLGVTFNVEILSPFQVRRFPLPTKESFFKPRPYLD